MFIIINNELINPHQIVYAKYWTAEERKEEGYDQSAIFLTLTSTENMFDASAAGYPMKLSYVGTNADALWQQLRETP